jgi:hypothetical protein
MCRACHATKFIALSIHLRLTTLDLLQLVMASCFDLYTIVAMVTMQSQPSILLLERSY